MRALIINSACCMCLLFAYRVGIVLNKGEPRSFAVLRGLLFAAVALFFVWPMLGRNKKERDV
jgi:hypothetical protein